MDTGKNKLSAEMMKKLYEAYKNTKKKKLDEFNEDAQKTISDKEYPEAEDILKLVEGTPITDNHEIRIHDYHGKHILHSFFDEPYPVMMPEDVETMKEMSDELMRNFKEDVSEELSAPNPMLGVTIQRVMSSKYFLKNDSIPDTVREEAEREALLYGDCYVFTGDAQNFKQQNYDKVKVLLDMVDTEAPDRNGRIWKRECMEKILNNKILLTAPRGRKSWLWLKLLEKELQKSYEINLTQSLETTPSTKADLKSVIHMRWPKQDLSNLKAHDFRYGKMWQDQALINYATGDVSHIDMVILNSLATFGPDINSGYGLSTPNLNDIDKKKLERVIKRRKRK